MIDKKIIINKFIQKINPETYCKVWRHVRSPRHTKRTTGKGGKDLDAEATVQVLADLHVVLHLVWRPRRDQKPASEWATERCKGGDGDFLN